MLIYLFIGVQVSRTGAEEIEFSYRNSFDNSEQKAVAYIPDLCKTKEKNPLLVIAHYMGGNRYTARKQGYYPECDARGYLLVCPELHGHRTGGETSMASLEAQHDIVDAITYMKKNYRVDSSRIYLAGRSMGGMLGGVMAAKYPDLFAAVVSGQGISDLKQWTETALPALRDASEKECRPYSGATKFDYERRSSVSYAPNFQYVPLIVWHGTNDTWVPPEQSELLVSAIRKYNRFQPDVNWLHGAPHCPENFTPGWICDQFQFYQNIGESGFETPTRFFPELNLVTDEAKSFFWLGVIPDADTSFARVHVNLKNDVIFARIENVRELTVNLDLVSKLTQCSKFDIRTDKTLHFSIVKNGMTVFETSVSTVKNGSLPDNLFKK